MITKDSTHLIPISRPNSHVSHLDNEEVNKETLNSDIEQYREQETPFQIINETRENTEEIKEQLNKQDQRIEYIGKAVYTILQKIENKPKVKRNTLPLRQPASNSIYYYLIEQQIETREKKLQFSRFRVAITILWATGLRVNETKSIKYSDIQTIINEKTLQIYQPKTKKYRIIHFSNEAVKQFIFIKPDIDVTFATHETLAGEMNESSWIAFINKRLINKTKVFGLNIKSHSFRVNFVTSLLKHAPLQIVANLVGHSNIATTVKYDRYHPNKNKTIELLQKAFTDND